VRVQVWHALLAQLELDARSGVLRPPARLKELLNRLIQLADPDAVVERKKSAAPDADVTYDSATTGWSTSTPGASAVRRRLRRSAAWPSGRRPPAAGTTDRPDAAASTR
jgi:hypothetical protein